MATSYLYAQSEVVSKKMPEFFGRFNLLSNLFSKGPVEMVNERDFRVPTITTEGGRPGTYNPNSGEVGLGSAGTGFAQISTFFSLRQAHQLSELSILATDNASQLKAFKRAVSKGLPEFADFVDRVAHNDGTAVIGTASAVRTVSAKTVYTMDNIRGVMGLRRGNYVIPYVNALSSAYDSGTPRLIEQIDYENRDVYLGAAVTSPLADDKLCFEGVSGATPAGPRGLRYWNSVATSGTTYGQDRALELEMVANGVDAGGTPTFQKALLLTHKIFKRRKELADGLVWISSLEQQANIYQQVLNYGMYDLSRGKDFMADLTPDPKTKFFKLAGQKAYLDIHQNTDVMDLIVPKEVIRARLAPVGFWSLPGDSTQRFFPLYGSGGSPAAAVWFAFSVHEDYVGANAGQGGVMYNCAQPTY